MALSLKLSKRLYWKIDRISTVLSLAMYVVAGQLVASIVFDALGYELDDILKTVDGILGIRGIADLILALEIQLAIFFMLGTLVLILIKSIGGRCAECGHPLEKHEDSKGISIEGGCKARKPVRNTIFKTNRCACSYFTQVKREKNVDFVDEETGIKIGRADKWIVLAIWIFALWGFRTILINLDPIFGSLGAITLAFVAIYSTLRWFKPARKYRAKFYAVMRKWYSRRIQLLIYLYLAWQITIVYAIHFGNEHYGVYLDEEFKPDSEKFIYTGQYRPLPANATDDQRVVYERIVNQTIFVKLEDESFPGKYFHTFALRMAETDRQWGGALGTVNYLFIYEEIEFVIFFILIRTGRLFKGT